MNDLRRLCLACLVLGCSLLAVGGCPGAYVPQQQQELCDNARDDDGNGLIDCADPACQGQLRCAGVPEAGWPLLEAGGPLPEGGGWLPDGGGLLEGGGPQPDQGAVTSLFTAVMNKLLLPTASGQYARDMDGSGPKNQLGAILGTVTSLAPSTNLQPSVDKQINSGSLILLFDLLTPSLSDAANMAVGIGRGADLDGNPADNFSGSETFAMVTTGNGVIKVQGAIVGGKLTADGDVAMAIPLGSKPVVITLTKGHLEAKVSTSGLTQGVVSGAIPATTITNVLIPGIAELLSDPTLDATVRALFDTDKNGTITAAELQTNPLIGLLLAPDVDTDGDGKKDALSMGLGFSALPCQIQPY